MITRQKIFTLLLSSLCMLAVSSSYAQSQQDMIQKARAAGMSESQIQEIIRKQQSSNNNNGNNKANYQKQAESPTKSRTERPYDLDKNKKVLRLKNQYDFKTKFDTTYKAYETLKTPSQFMEPDSLKGQYFDFYYVEEKDPRNTVFGREIFTGEDLTFAPDYNLATPKGYRLAAGDEVAINIWGASSLYFTGVISPDGNVVIPDVGPIHLAGLSVEEAEKRLKNQLSQVYGGLSGDNPNTYVQLSLANIRSIKVNIVGEAVRPGTYTLPSLATLFNALYVAGGVNDIGSLRSVKVYRNSKLIADMDVYDYLLNGKYDSNIRLEDNDMVIISPYANLVKAAGKVKRERIFELAKNEKMADLIRYAGGFRGDAYSDNVELHRKSGRMYQVYTVDAEDYPSYIMADGDSVTIGAVIERFENRVIARGAFMRPGTYGLSDNVRTVKELINKAEGLRGDAFLQRAQLTRQKQDFTREVIALNMVDILDGSQPDVELREEDELYIPSIYDIQEDFQLSVKGAVNNPRNFPYRSGMTIEDLIIQAGGLKQSASKSKIEVSRRIRNPYSNTYTDKIAENYSFSIGDKLDISPEASKFELQPFDEVFIRVSPGYQQQQNVFIQGEVLFGGEYTMASRGQRLSDLVAMSGGVTPLAYVKGARLSRKLNDEERRKVEDKLKLAQQGGKDSIDMKTLDISDTYFVGIDLVNALENPGSDADLVLREGDILLVPEYTNTVTISGSVMYPNTVVYNPKMTVSQYIQQGGGYSQKAKKSKAFIVYMNGRVATVSSNSPKLIEAGCEIIVPARPERKGVGLAEIMGMTNSMVSMAAMLTSILK